MITVPILGQRDYRWVKIPLGFLGGTIGDYGCLLTVLTSLAGKNNVGEVNDIFKNLGNYPANPNGAFQGNLVVWFNVPKALKNLKFVYRYYYYDNAKVSDYVYNKKTPVIVEVDAAPIGSPKSSHFVLFLGDHKCLDPWVGQIRSTEDFPERKGFALYDYVTIPTPILTCEQKLVIDETKINKARTTLSRSDVGDSDKVRLAKIDLG